MKHLKTLIVLSMLIANNLPFWAQKDYIQNDTTLHYGVEVYNNGPKLNSQYCEYELRGKKQQSGPDKILEYKTSDLKYVSKTIVLNEDSVTRFLELLCEGKYNLYYYQDSNTTQYYLERDSTMFIPLTHSGDRKKQLRHTLKTLQLAPHDPDAIQYVNKRRYSLSTYIEAINEDSKRPFPHIQYGLSAGLTLINFKNPSNYKELKLYGTQRPLSYALSLGGFISLPIMCSSTTTRSELHLSSYRTKENYSNQNTDIDLLSNVLWFDYQQVIRHTFDKVKRQPYLEGGLAISLTAKDNTQLHSSTYADKHVTINAPYTPTIYPKQMLGYSAGTGLNIALSGHQLSLGLRATHLFPFSDSQTYGKQTLTFRSHFTF